MGRKILASGNGRCNLTNLSAAPWAYNHPDFVEPVLGRYPCEGIRSFFGEMGLLTYADDEGRVYPVTNTASSVLDVLRLECAHLGVEERCGFEAARISEAAGSAGFEVSSRGGETVRADAVVVTTGGGGSLLADIGTRAGGARSRARAHQDGRRAHPRPLRRSREVRGDALAGVDDDGAGGEPVATERGELLFRDYGVSGIMVFDLSRFLEEGCVISIDLFPDVDPREISRR